MKNTTSSMGLFDTLTNLVIYSHTCMQLEDKYMNAH